ncbi:MAG: DUF368 domain-containing protein [Flavobacteriaceae bacterium]|nr:DUF368 domain-containing protein [Flavobacteriaceae bacterium]
MQRTFFDYFIISLKGIAMGAADVVPGVSGGTIAFISGIYEELINSINSVNFHALKVLKNDGLPAAWKTINGNFLLALLVGIAISVLSLVKIIKWLLENEPVLLWSFFFGLVLASIFYVGQQITKWRLSTIVILILGATIAFYITTLPPLATNDSHLYLVFAGSLAICAMILPGISGAFILLLLGAYKPAVDAINDKDLKTIFYLAIGAIIGLLTFSRLLKWLFDHYKNLTLAALTGFIIGSLNKIWPWKEVLSWRTNSKGEQLPFLDKSISPFNYDGDPQLILAIFFMFIGMALILLLEKSAIKKIS